MVGPRSELVPGVDPVNMAQKTSPLAGCCLRIWNCQCTIQKGDRSALLVQCLSLRSTPGWPSCHIIINTLRWGSAIRLPCTPLNWSIIPAQYEYLDGAEEIQEEVQVPLFVLGDM